MATRADLRSMAQFLCVVASLFTLMGCPSPTKVDGGVDAGGECLDNTDCPDSQLFFCNTSTSKCEQACRTREQCTAAVRGQYALDFCNTTNGALGCECDEGKCVASLCSVDADCGASAVCRSGSCVTAPAATTVAKCQITPDFVVLKKGAKAKFWVSSWDAANAPVVLKDGATWAAASGSVLTGSGSGVSAEFTAASVSASGAATAVEATVGGIKCTAKALVLSDVVAADQVAVVVIDELSGRPVPDADILVSKTDGTPIGTTVKTDAKGFATVPVTGAPAQVSVTAFSADHAYVTIANYPMSGSRFLSIVTRRNQTDKFGGYKGTFKNVPVNANVHAAIGGVSLAGSITSLSLTQLAGPSVPTDIKIGSAIDQKGVGIPAGVYLGFGDQTFKKDIAGQGLAGVCLDSSGAPDEAKINAGECGTRSAWALAGDVALGDLPIDAFKNLNNLDYGDLLSRIQPIFKKFNSSVVRDVSFTLKTTPKDAQGHYIFTKPDGGLDQDHFASVDHDFTQVPLAFSFAAKVADLPKFRGTYVDGAAIIGGANVPGRGVVPLGLGVGVNTDNNAIIDKQAGYPTAGLIQVRMAPTHHGLEGSEYGLVIAAISAKSVTDSSAGVGSSAIYARVPGNKLVFDPSGTSKIDVSNLSFPVFPEGPKFNYTDALVRGIPGRSLRLVNNPAIELTGINVVRVSFTDDLDHHWDVVVDPTVLSATSGFTLPKPPGTLTDRLFGNGMAAGTRSAMVVQALRLNSNPAPGSTGGAPISFTEFVEFNSTNADRTTDFLTGFSFMDMSVPKVKFTTPKDYGSDAAPVMVAKGTKLVLKVSNFRVGTTADADGVVTLGFSSAGAPVAACPDQVLSAEATAGSGTVEYTLPAACVGTKIKMTATLALPPVGTAAPAPIQPGVSTINVATIQ